MGTVEFLRFKVSSSIGSYVAAGAAATRWCVLFLDHFFPFFWPCLASFLFQVSSSFGSRLLLLGGVSFFGPFLALLGPFFVSRVSSSLKQVAAARWMVCPDSELVETCSAAVSRSRRIRIGLVSKQLFQLPENIRNDWG